VLRFLIFALCLVAIVLPLPLIAIALFVGGLTLATLHVDEVRCDVQRLARIALTPLRAPPAALR
jgi:hypothetical protein